MSNQAFYLHYSSVIASLKKKKAKQERENKSVKIKKLEIQEALFVEVQETCRMRKKRAVINKITSFFVAVYLSSLSICSSKDFLTAG